MKNTINQNHYLPNYTTNTTSSLLLTATEEEEGGGGGAARVWEEHIKQEKQLQIYSKAMHSLATKYWSSDIEVK